MCRLLGVFLSLGIAHRHLGIARPVAAGWTKASIRSASRLGRNQAIPFSTGEAGRSGAAGRDHHRRLDIRPVE